MNRRISGAALLVAALIPLNVSAASQASEAPVSERAAANPCKHPVLTLHARSTTYRFVTAISQSGVITTDPPDSGFGSGPDAAGTMRIGFTTCPSSSSPSGWQAVSKEVDNAQPQIIKTVVGSRVTSVKPVSGNAAYGAQVLGVGEKTISVEMFVCHAKPTRFKDSVYRGFTGLLSMPWKAPTSVRIALRVGKALLPDAPSTQYWCARMGDAKHITYSVNSKGGITPYFGSWAGRLSFVQHNDPILCGESYRYCAWTYRQQVSFGR